MIIYALKLFEIPETLKCRENENHSKLRIISKYFDKVLKLFSMKCIYYQVPQNLATLIWNMTTKTKKSKTIAQSKTDHDDDYLNLSS